MRIPTVQAFKLSRGVSTVFALDYALIAVMAIKMHALRQRDLTNVAADKRFSDAASSQWL